MIKDKAVSIRCFFDRYQVDRGIGLDEERAVFFFEEDTSSIMTLDILEIDDIAEPEDNISPPVAVADPLGFWIQVEPFEHGEYFFICIQGKRFSN